LFSCARARRGRPAALDPPGRRPIGLELLSMDQLAQLAERLVRFRTQAGMEIETAAAAAEINADRLDLAEAGSVALDEDELGRLARTYGIDPTELFGGRITPFQNYAGG
jgi:Helix-turn-helix domain